MNYLARRSLFDSRLFGAAIRLLDAIPLEHDGLGIGGIKETLKRLKRDELVLIFPEGTRTANGRLQKFRSGFIVLARRTKVPLIPVAIHGAFEAWPRQQKHPRLGRIVVGVGEPIAYENYKELDDDQLLELLAQRIQSEYDALDNRFGPQTPDSDS